MRRGGHFFFRFVSHETITHENHTVIKRLVYDVHGRYNQLPHYVCKDYEYASVSNDRSRCSLPTYILYIPNM